MKSRLIDNHKHSQSELILELNPILKGCANYYSTVTCVKVFGKMASLVEQKISSWAEQGCHKTSKESSNKSRQFVGV
ncbi:group II intron maturase-specific domain-containing protein [Microseira wollei]|uniref:group II intron maturase-specific domain-containing protein n=1 Tax=Microseira wollei TaxID=467598 RepID=UPI001CFC797D